MARACCTTHTTFEGLVHSVDGLSFRIDQVVYTVTRSKRATKDIWNQLLCGDPHRRHRYQLVYILFGKPLHFCTQ